MFYATEPSRKLRMGDIVEGFAFAFPRVDSPESRPLDRYNITMHHPRYAAVLTPCCSIENQELLLAPLRNISKSYYDNEYFREDMTRINRLMSPKNSISAQQWDAMGPEGLNARFGGDLKSPIYALLDVFIYNRDDRLEKYMFKSGKECNYYMITFREIARMETKAAIRDNEETAMYKLLELSIDARKELRDKMANYFGRIV